jgi:hypothetical protein
MNDEERVMQRQVDAAVAIAMQAVFRACALQMSAEDADLFVRTALKLGAVPQLDLMALLKGGGEAAGAGPRS